MQMQARIHYASSKQDTNCEAVGGDRERWRLLLMCAFRKYGAVKAMFPSEIRGQLTLPYVTWPVSANRTASDGGKSRQAECEAHHRSRRRRLMAVDSADRERAKI